MNAARTQLFYMANLGSEVGRLCAASERSEVEAQAPLKRCLNIIDDYARVETVPSHMQEIAVLSDVLKDIAHRGRRFQVSSDELDSYFAPFAARLLAHQ